MVCYIEQNLNTNGMLELGVLGKGACQKTQKLDAWFDGQRSEGNPPDVHNNRSL